MARATRSEWQVNRQLAETPRARALPVQDRRALPVLQVARWIGGGLLAVLVLGEVLRMV